MLKKMLMCFCLFAYMLGVSAGTDGVVEDSKKGDVAVKNLTRAMTLLDNTIDAPLFCLRVRSKRIGAFVIVKIIKEPCHQALITFHVFSIKLWTVAF